VQAILETHSTIVPGIGLINTDDLSEEQKATFIELNKITLDKYTSIVAGTKELKKTVTVKPSSMYT